MERSDIVLCVIVLQCLNHHSEFRLPTILNYKTSDIPNGHIPMANGERVRSFECRLDGERKIEMRVTTRFEASTPFRCNCMIMKGPNSMSE